jgi:hypothetical protein
MNNEQVTVMVYLDDGRVFEYDVENAAKGREHAGAILRGGYRHNSGANYCEYYPTHRISKVKIAGDVDTLHPDRVRGT